MDVLESTYYVWQTLLIPGILLGGGFDSLCLAYERNEGAVVRCCAGLCRVMWGCAGLCRVVQGCAGSHSG